MNRGISNAFAQAVQEARLDPLDAFISVVDETEAGAGVAAQGPLAGVPYAVKDNIDTVALPTTANTPALLGSIREVDNPAVDRLNRAGALLVGKTNLHELAFGITTNAAAHPATRNPFDPTRSPGGSSGGSGSAVGSGIVPFALATDTGGSASIPAAWCGVYGYRPSMARWPKGGVAPLSKTRDTVGVIAESLALVRLVDEVVREEGMGTVLPASIRIGVPEPDSQYLNPLGDDVREVWEAALGKLRTIEGVELVTVDTGRLHELDEACSIGIVLYETARDLEEYLAELPTPVSYATVMEQAAAEDVRGLLAVAYEQREEHAAYGQMLGRREELRSAWDDLFAGAGIDALLRPTVPITATPIGDDSVTTAFGEEVPTFATCIRNTSPGSLAGQPSVTLPGGIGSAGLPVGISLDGARDDDDRLLAVASVLDELIGVRSPLLADTVMPLGDATQ